MLSCKNRLIRKKDFEEVFKKAKSSYDKIIGVKVAVNQFSYSRFGILVGLKVSKEAVLRNKIKRRIREAIRPQVNLIKRGLDVVIITLPPIKDKELNEIENSVRGHFRKLRLY
jgi:ribonuclease P protein component